MIKDIPKDFKHIWKTDFDRWLNNLFIEYERENWAGLIEYKWKCNKKPFAYWWEDSPKIAIAENPFGLGVNYPSAFQS